MSAWSAAGHVRQLDGAATSRRSFCTYSHCNVQRSSCAYTCEGRSGLPNFGSWNISALDSEGCGCHKLRPGVSPEYEFWSANSIRKLGGFWYSTVSPAPGDVAQWEQVQVVKTIEKSCADELHYASIEHSDAGAECFRASACPTGKGSRDVKSDCYIRATSVLLRGGARPSSECFV